LNKRNTLKFNFLFVEFLDYLIQLGYGEERTGFIEGVFQRAFFDEWVEFLAWQREIKGPFAYIKAELFDEK